MGGAIADTREELNDNTQSAAQRTHLLLHLLPRLRERKPQAGGEAEQLGGGRGEGLGTGAYRREGGGTGRR